MMSRSKDANTNPLGAFIVFALSLPVAYLLLFLIGLTTLNIDSRQGDYIRSTITGLIIYEIIMLILSFTVGYFTHTKAKYLLFIGSISGIAVCIWFILEHSFIPF